MDAAAGVDGVSCTDDDVANGGTGRYDLSRWSGKTPKTMLLEWFQKMQAPRPKIELESVGRRYRAYVVVVGDTKLELPGDEVFDKREQAEQAAATAALYHLFGTGKEKQPLYRMLPPAYRTLWLGWVSNQQTAAAQLEADSAAAALIERERFVDRLVDRPIAPRHYHEACARVVMPDAAARSSSSSGTSSSGSSLWFPSSTSENSSSDTDSDVSVNRVAPGNLMGSAAHEDGNCIPCVYWARGICSQADACLYCHLEHSQIMPKKIGARKKMPSPSQSNKKENGGSAGPSVVSAVDLTSAAAPGGDARRNIDADVTGRRSSVFTSADSAAAAAAAAGEAHGDAGPSIDKDVTHAQWLWSSHRHKPLVLGICLLVLAISVSIQITLKLQQL